MNLFERHLKRPPLKEIKEKERKSPLQLQKRDIEIFKLLFDHRIMNLRQLEHLLGMTGTGKRQSLRRRMRQLYLHHYLDQPEDSIYLKLKYPQNPDYNTSIYGLAARGITVLCHEEGLDLEESLRKRRNDLHFLYLEHSVYLSRFYTVLELALRRREEFELCFWRQGREIEVRLQEKRLPYKLKSWTLRPDAFFAIRERATGKRRYYFAEADLSGQQRVKTMTDKYRRYLEFWRQRAYERFGIEKEEGFQVLTFCYKQKRLQPLLEIFDRFLPWRELGREKKPTMFLFCHDFGSYEEPERILERIWISPKGELFSLVDF